MTAFLSKWVHNTVNNVMSTFGNLKRFQRLFIIKRNCIKHLEAESQIRCFSHTRKEKKKKKTGRSILLIEEEKVGVYFL